MAGAMETVLTIDGPAGSGKSTTARAVAERLGWRHLDSGALYRALTWALLEEGTPPGRWGELGTGELASLGIALDTEGSRIRVVRDGEELDEELRGDAVTRHVSRLAAVPAVRAWLLRVQRAAAEEGRLVVDGRDTGTVVFPDAGTKIFLEATPEERARRRLRDKGVEAPDAEEILREVERLEERDRRDRDRTHAPLRVPDDAVVIDTTDTTFAEQVDRIVREARRRVPVADD